MAQLKVAMGSSPNMAGEVSGNKYYISQPNNVNGIGIHNGDKIVHNYWGSAPEANAEDDHALARDKRKEDDSCKWLLGKDSFTRCVKVDDKVPEYCRSSVLWIYGKVGCGKSTLMSRVIDHIKELDEKDRGHLLFFYVGFRDEKHDSWRRMLSTFWSQATPTKEQNEFSDTRKTRKIQDDLIEFLAKSKRPVYVVVDALDQLRDENQNDVFCGLQALARRFFNSKTKSRLTIIVSSRHAPSWAEFKVDQKLDIEVRPSDTQADIESYLSNHLDQHLLYKHGEFLTEQSRREDLKKRVIKALEHHADGMFLWVQLQAHLICQAISPSGVSDHLENLTLPGEIEKMYRDLVESFEEHPDDQARRTALGTIALLVHGEGSFSQHKLRAAFVPPSDNPQTPEIITRLCQSLVEFSEDLGVFRFSHVSIYDYFRKWDKMDTVIAEITLAHLCFSEFERGPFEGAPWIDPGKLQEFVNLHPFLEFASCNWASSMARTPKDKHPHLMELLTKLCKLDNEQQAIMDDDTSEENESINGNSRNEHESFAENDVRKDERLNLHLSFQVYLLSCEETMASGVRLAHIFSFFGLTDFFNWFHDKGWLDPNATDSDGLMAIHWAIRGSSTKDMSLVVQKLVQYGGNVDSRDNEGRTPLHYASKSGDLNAVTMLLNNNAKLNVLSQSNTTALIAAALEDHCPTVLKLIDAGADVAALSFSGTALSAVSLMGCYNCAEVILKKLRERDGRHPFACEIRCPDTALHNAAFSGSTKIVKLLLAENFDVNVTSSKFGTALTAAAVGCIGQEKSTPYLEICEMLLKKKVDLNVTEGKYGLALRAAAVHGDEKLVQLLLDHGADVNAAGCMGTAYQAAIDGRHTRVQEMLAAAGADNSEHLEASHRQSFLSPEHTVTRTFEDKLQWGSRRLAKAVIERGELIFRFYIKRRNYRGLQLMVKASEEAFAIVVSKVINKEARRRGPQNHGAISEDKEGTKRKAREQDSRNRAQEEETGSMNSQELDNGPKEHARGETQEPRRRASAECSTPNHHATASNLPISSVSNSGQRLPTSDGSSGFAAWFCNLILCCCPRASTDGDEEASRAPIPTTQAQETPGQRKVLSRSHLESEQPEQNRFAVPHPTRKIQRTPVSDSEQDQSSTATCELPTPNQSSLPAASSRIGSFPVDSSEDFLPSVLDHLTQVGVSILQYAIAQKDPKAIDIIATSWTNALHTLVARANFGEGLLARVVKSRTEDLRQHLTNTKLTVPKRFKKATQLTEVGIELLLAVIKRGEDYAQLTIILSRLWVSAVHAVEELGADGQKHVQDLVEVFAKRFQTADKEAVKVLAKSGLEVLGAVALSPNKSLMNKFVLVWVREWQGVHDRGMEDLTNHLLECKLQEYKDCIRKQQYRDARGIAVAGIGLLRASIESSKDKVQQRLLVTVNDAFLWALDAGPFETIGNLPEKAPEPEIAMHMECILRSVVALFAVAKEKNATLDDLAGTLLRWEVADPKTDLESLGDMIKRLKAEAQQRHHGDGYELGPKQVSSAIAFYNSIMQKEDR